MFRATMTLLRRGAAAYATTSGVPETPIRPRFKKFEGRIIKGKPMRVREREVVENDEETRTFEDVQQHIEYGLVRPRTPMLDKCKIGFVSLPEAVQLRLNDIVRTVPRDRILVCCMRYLFKTLIYVFICVYVCSKRLLISPPHFARALVSLSLRLLRASRLRLSSKATLRLSLFTIVSKRSPTLRCACLASLVVWYAVSLFLAPPCSFLCGVSQYVVVSFSRLVS